MQQSLVQVCAQSAARSRNRAGLVVVLLGVLGIRTVEVLATDTLTTDGLRGQRRANVSFEVIASKYIVHESV